VEFRIRTARQGDLEEVFRLERTTPEAPHWSREEYAALIGPAVEGAVRRCLLVAEALEDGGPRDVVGFAVGKIIEVGTEPLGELESVLVAQTFRRAGIGRALCLGVLEWCRERGSCSVELEVRSRNESARTLYAALGFVEEGLRRGYYQDPPDDAVLMRMEAGGRG